MKAIDTSALAKLLLKEEGWEKVLGHLKEGAVSVDLIVKEAANVVWRRTGGDIKKAEPMLEALKELAEKVIRTEDERTHLDEAVRIAFNHNITVYDALYVALAKTLKTPLITSDLKQAKIAEKLGVHTITV